MSHCVLGRGDTPGSVRGDVGYLGLTRANVWNGSCSFHFSLDSFTPFVFPSPRGFMSFFLPLTANPDPVPVYTKSEEVMLCAPFKESSALPALASHVSGIVLSQLFSHHI